jgi:tripartite-type tricarboxylate transporter receptor subunit TctC
MKYSAGITASIYCVLAAFAPSFSGAADESTGFPNRPIRFIIPAPPGGTTDILGRLVGQHLTEVFKQQVVVDNRGGAGGVVAAEITAKAAPDGYTLLVAYTSHTINATLNPKVPYRPVDDYRPITQATRAGLVLVVNLQLPVKSVQELIAYGKANPGKLNFSSAGNGSGGHMAGELLKMMTGIKAQHVPYKGTGPSLIDLAGGQVQMSFAGMVPVQPLIRSGRVRALAVTTAQRIPSLPDLPTVAESGVPGFEVVGWYGFLAPAGVPKPIVAKFHTEIVKVLRDPEVTRRLTTDGAEIVASAPDEFEKFLRADIVKWAKVVKASAAQLD